MPTAATLRLAASEDDPHPTQFRIIRQRLWVPDQPCQVTYETEVAIKDLSPMRASCLTYLRVRNGEYYTPIAAAMCPISHYAMMAGPVRHQAFLDIERRAKRLAAVLTVVLYPEAWAGARNPGTPSFTLDDIVFVDQQHGIDAARECVCSADTLAPFGF